MEECASNSLGEPEEFMMLFFRSVTLAAMARCCTAGVAQDAVQRSIDGGGVCISISLESCLRRVPAPSSKKSSLK